MGKTRAVYQQAPHWQYCQDGVIGRFLLYGNECAKIYGEPGHFILQFSDPQEVRADEDREFTSVAQAKKAFAKRTSR